MKRFATLTLLLAVILLTSISEARMIYFPQGFNISNMVKRADLIVVGKVESVEFVYRDEIPAKFTTDVAIEVTETIKGEPNAGADRVKFMQIGGRGIDPVSGQDLTLEVDGIPKFERNQRVLVFLRKSRRADDNWPHDGYHLTLGYYGKRVIDKDKVNMPYTFDRNVNRHGKIVTKKVNRSVQFPLDLVILLAKASMKDVDATKLMEDHIKGIASSARDNTQAKIDEELIEEFRAESKRILEARQDEANRQ